MNKQADVCIKSSSPRSLHLALGCFLTLTFCNHQTSPMAFLLKGLTIFYGKNSLHFEKVYISPLNGVSNSNMFVLILSARFGEWFWGLFSSCHEASLTRRYGPVMTDLVCAYEGTVDLCSGTDGSTHTQDGTSRPSDPEWHLYDGIKENRNLNYFLALFHFLLMVIHYGVWSN